MGYYIFTFSIWMAGVYFISEVYYDSIFDVFSELYSGSILVDDFFKIFLWPFVVPFYFFVICKKLNNEKD